MALRTFFYKIVREIAVATVIASAVSASAVTVAASGKAASKAFSGIGATVRAAALELIRAAVRPVQSAIAAVVARIGAAGAVSASDVAVAARGKAASKAFSGIDAATAAALGLIRAAIAAIRAAFRPVLSAIAVVVARIGAADAVSGTVIEAIASITIAAKAIVARISMMISATSVTTAVSRLLSQIFSRLFLTPSSPRPSTKHYATPALLTVAFRCLKAVCSVVWNLCSKLNSSQIARIWHSAFSSLAGVAYSLTFVKDFALKTPALPSRSRYSRNHQQRHGSPILRNSNTGVIIVLLVLFVPIIFAGMKYSEKLFSRRQEVLDTPTYSVYYKKCAEEIALAVAKTWNPGKTLGNQKESVYATACAAYNAACTYEEKISPLSAAISGFVGEKSGVALLDPSLKQVSYPPAKGADYVKISVEPYSENTNIGKIMVQTDDRDTTYAIPATCNLDVILAVPTNSDVAVAEIGEASKNFIDNIGHSCGVYTSLIPYSGKLSIPSDRASAWTFKFPAFKTDDGSTQLLSGACLYGTKGVDGTSLSTHYSWNNTACPIMFRRGSENTDSSYGDNLWYSGNLLSTTNPATSNESKYIQMNLQPCNLSNASILSMKCGANCTEFSANPNAMIEPTADVALISSKCGSLVSSGDKSNFIFAALEWAANMFQGWTNDPKQIATINGDSTLFGSETKTTLDRKKAIVLVVNKPDHFEPGEMTYMGFSDDCKEEEVGIEKIDFRKNFGSNPIKSDRGALQFSGGVSYTGGCYQCSNETTCTFTLKQRHTIKLVVEPTNNVGEITFKNILNETDIKKPKKDSMYYVIAEREFFIESGQIADNLTVQFSAKNVKFVSAIITNHTISTGTYTNAYVLSNDRFTLSIKTNCQKPIKPIVEPTSWIQFDGGSTQNITGETVIWLGERSSNVPCAKQGVDIIRICRGRLAVVDAKSFKEKNFWTTSGINHWGTNHNYSYILPEQPGVVIFEALGSPSDTLFSGYINPYGSGLNGSVYGNSVLTSTYQTYKGPKNVLKGSSQYAEIMQDNKLSFTLYIKSISACNTGILKTSAVYFGNPLSYDGSAIIIPETVPVLLEVKPLLRPSLSYTNFNGSTIVHSSDISTTGDTTLIIFPKYTRQADGTYTTTVNLTNVCLSSGYIGGTDQIYTGQVITEGSVSTNGSSAIITTHKCPSEIKLTVTPKYISSIKFDGEANKRLVSSSMVFDLGERSANVGYTKEYVDIFKVGKALPAEVICTIPATDSRQDFTYNLREQPAIINFTRKVGNYSAYIYYGYDTGRDYSRGFLALKGESDYKKFINNSTLSFGIEEGIGDFTLEVSAIYFGSALSYNASAIMVPSTSQVLVEAKPSDSTRPSFSYTNASGATETHIDDVNSSGPTTITITPKWTEVRKNTYRTKINIKNISSVSAEFVDAYEEVESDSGNVALRNATGKEDPTEGAKEMTKKWCNKLKADYGANLRLYVVEYGVPKGVDTAYIEKCATDTGGNVKKASDNVGLKAALDEIAADLKSWAGYTEARVVN